MKQLIITFITTIAIIISGCSINSNRINNNDITKAIASYITNYDYNVSVGDSLNIIPIYESKDIEVIRITFNVSTIKSNNKIYPDTINLIKNKNNNELYSLELNQIY